MTSFVENYRIDVLINFPEWVIYLPMPCDTNITKMINEHKEMIDTIQDVALELTTTIGSLHVLTVKYARKANEILDIILPLIKSIPLIPDKVEDLLVQMEKWTQKIIDNEKETSKTVADVQSGLRTGDVDKIKEHTGELKKISNTISGILPQK